MVEWHLDGLAGAVCFGEEDDGANLVRPVVVAADRQAGLVGAPCDGVGDHAGAEYRLARAVRSEDLDMGEIVSVAETVAHQHDSAAHGQDGGRSRVLVGITEAVEGLLVRQVRPGDCPVAAQRCARGPRHNQTAITPRCNKLKIACSR